MKLIITIESDSLDLVDIVDDAARGIAEELEFRPRSFSVTITSEKHKVPLYAKERIVPKVEAISE